MDPFEHYFHGRIDVAEDLMAGGLSVEGCGLATAILDALGAIWFHDFPTAKADVDRDCGGRTPSSIRMTRLLREFAPGETLAQRVAVVCFAEDWQRHAPNTAAPATRLLESRIGNLPGELPHSYQDVTMNDLVAECPEIESPRLRALAEEYTYPALVYRFYRCPMLHYLSPAHRTHGFTVGAEIMYMRLRANFTSISFGPKLLSRWARAAISGYMAACAGAGVRPATNLDPGEDAEDALRQKWSHL